MRTSRGMILGMVLALTLGACANTGLRTIRNSSNGPDEFLVQPVKPLQLPPDIAALPPPTPGGSNLVYGMLASLLAAAIWLIIAHWMMLRLRLAVGRKLRQTPLFLVAMAQL